MSVNIKNRFFLDDIDQKIRYSDVRFMGLFLSIVWLVPKPQQTWRLLKRLFSYTGFLGRINNILMLLPFSRWLRICSRTAAKLLNSGDESSIVSKQDRSIRVFTENLWKKKDVCFRESKSIYLSMKKWEGIWKRIMKIWFIYCVLQVENFTENRLSHANHCRSLMRCSPRSYMAKEAQGTSINRLGLRDGRRALPLVTL